jgi:hypothetical protein
VPTRTCSRSRVLVGPVCGRTTVPGPIRDSFTWPSARPVTAGMVPNKPQVVGMRPQAGCGAPFTSNHATCQTPVATQARRGGRAQTPQRHKPVRGTNLRRVRGREGGGGGGRGASGRDTLHRPTKARLNKDSHRVAPHFRPATDVLARPAAGVGQTKNTTQSGCAATLIRGCLRPPAHEHASTTARTTASERIAAAASSSGAAMCGNN